MSISPSRVNLHQLRKQAKELHRLSQSHPSAADLLARIRRSHPRFADASPQDVSRAFSLQEAQHVIARELNYDSWPKLVGALEDREAADREGRFLRDELRGIENLHEMLARHVHELYSQAGSGSKIEIQYVDQVSWSDFIGSRLEETWTYGYEFQPLEGFAWFDVPLPTINVLAAVAADRIPTTFVGDLKQQIADSVVRVSGEHHRRFIVPLLDDGIEAAWQPVLNLNMAQIELEDEPPSLWHRAPEPNETVAYVQLTSADGEIALRTCYTHAALRPVLPSLEKLGSAAH